MTFQVDQNKKTPYDPIFSAMEEKYGLPGGLLKTTALIENRNNIQNRVSPKGASGVMQIMPANYESLGITDPNDQNQSIEGAAKLYSQLNKQYDGDVGAMMAHYNGGNKSGRRYQEGKSLNPETTDYIKYASPYLESIGKVSKYGQSVQHAADSQLEGAAPSDLPLPQDSENPDEFAYDLNEKFERELAEESHFFELSLNEAVKQGFKATMTSAIGHAYSREEDPDFQMGQEQFDAVKQAFPQGLDTGSEQRLYNSRSQSDFEYNLGRIQGDADFGRKLGNQSGLGAVGGYAAMFAGSLFDPVALPLGTFGLAGRAIKGTGLAYTVGRGMAEGAAASAIASPVIQQLDKGHIDGEELLFNVAAGTMMGGVIGGAQAKLFGKHEAAWKAESERPTVGRAEQQPDYQPVPATKEGEVVNFQDAVDTEIGADGSIVGVGPTAVNMAARNWDETVTTEMQRVLDRRAKWYGNETRQKVTGWADSEGVRLATSKDKVARFVGAMWAGNAAGIGKTEARNAATLKAQLKEQMDWTYIPSMKEHFESFMTPAEKLDYMAGGAKDAQARFSREVQLERYRHREYRVANENNSKGYRSEAPAAVQRAAKVLDDMYADSKAMHMQSGTRHADQLKDSDPIGYIEQRTDYNKLQALGAEERKAFLSMVKDDYHAEATAKIGKMKAEKDEWIDGAYKRFESDMDNPNLGEFLKDPSAYFDKHIEKLSKKLHDQMDKRASHWWENALSNPEMRYQNSEAGLITLMREMSDEWFTGKQVDADLVKTFQKAVTDKWADTSRRELNMLNTRNVNGQDMYLLDMFQHDVFGSMTRNIQNTSGRVAMAKMGWKNDPDIADTLSALAQSGATPRELEAAKNISDIILNRAMGIDDSPLVQSVSNLTHSAMMGKLATSLLSDIPTIVGNLGVGGMSKALGNMAKQAINGQMFVKNGRKTKLGNDLDAYMQGLTGHDHELWIPQQLNSDGFAMEAGGSLLRRTAAAARMTNSLSGANMVSRSIGTAITQTTTKAFHKVLRTGKGISENRLADVGFHGKEMARIKKQFDQYGTKEGFGLDKWDDPYAKEVFISGVHRFVNQNRIDSQVAGELPKWTRDNMLGSLYARFRAIGIRAQEKILVRNLTHADSNAMAMIAAGLAWSTFLAYARIHMDAATSKDGKKVLDERLSPIGLADTVMRLSSVMGLGAELTGVADLVTGGGVVGGSDTPLTGAVGNITGAATAVGKAATGAGDWSQAGAASFKLLPGSNTYLLMGMKKAVLDE